MSSCLHLEMTPTQTSPEVSLEAGRSRPSLVATLRRTTSRIFLGGIATATQEAAKNTPQPTLEDRQPEKEKQGSSKTDKTRPNWFSSTTRRRRHQEKDLALAASSESSQEANTYVELREETTAMTTTQNSSPTTEGSSPFEDRSSTSPLSPTGFRRRFFSSSRLKLQIHSPFRRRNAGDSEDASPRSSLSRSDSDKENFAASAAEQPSPTLPLSDSLHSLASPDPSVLTPFSSASSGTANSSPASSEDSLGRSAGNLVWTDSPASPASSRSSYSNNDRTGNKTPTSALTIPSPSPGSLEESWSPSSSQRTSQESEATDENTVPVVARSPWDDENSSGVSVPVGGEGVSGTEQQQVCEMERTRGDGVVARMMESAVVRPILSGHL
ncbi:hypothetical protein VTJ83DRAFT_1281 [Remersonia thermophila]|uniref:Uncharacterized protein n=1 Tax=Remersonia thermophila TaxID=72144 RepID=A0ABR4DNK2_9PEZI